MKIPEAKDKNTGCKSLSGQRMEKIEKLPARQLEKIKLQEGGYSGSTKREKESALCYIDGHLKKCGVRTKISEIQRSSKERSVWRNKKSPKRGPFPSRKADCSLDLRILPGHWSQRFCLELCRPIDYWSSKWRYSGIRFKVGRNFIVYDENPTW